MWSDPFCPSFAQKEQQLRCTMMMMMTMMMMIIIMMMMDDDDHDDHYHDDHDDHDDDDDDYDDDDDADDEIRITSCYYYVSPFNQHLGILFLPSVAIWVVLLNFAQVQPDSEVRIRQ